MVIQLKLKTSQRSYPPTEQYRDNKEEIRKNLYNSSISSIESQNFTQPREDEMMTNSCISPDVGSTHSAKEMDERNILDEPMIAKALELFSPKKVRIMRNS